MMSLWRWGIKNARKDGFIPYADRRDIVVALSSSATGSSLDLTQVVDVLVESGWLDESENGLYIHDWDVWQEHWYKALERRENDVKRKRDAKLKGAEIVASRQQTAGNSAEIPQENPQEEQLRIAEEPKAESKYSKSFEEFWEAYPRHDEKASAYKCYQTRLKDGFSEEEMLEAAKAYAAKCVRDRTEKKYTKLGRTFLGPNTPFVDFIQKHSKPPVENGGNPFIEYGEDD